MQLRARRFPDRGKPCFFYYADGGGVYGINETLQPGRVQ